MTEQEAETFLDRPNLCRLATVDGSGNPHVTAVWFLWSQDKIYVLVDSYSKKIKNIRRRPIVGFCIDEYGGKGFLGTEKPKGIHGQGSVQTLSDLEKVRSYTESILVKYTGDLKNPFAKSILDGLSELSILEITPIQLSGWDSGK